MAASLTADLCLTALCAVAMLFALRRKTAAGPDAGTAEDKKTARLLFWAIFAAGLFLRLYRLAEIPSLDCDEASSMYDAYCLANFGTDRWLYSYPLYFSGLAGGQSPMCLYLLALTAKLFGYSVFAYRCVFVAAGMATACVLYLTVRDMLGRRYALLCFLFVNVTPLFVLLSRYCLDCNLMMPFFAGAIYFAQRALTTGKRGAYFWAGVFAGLTLYTYILAYVIVFLFVLFLAAAFCLQKKRDRKAALCFLLPLAVLAVVPMLNALVQMGVLPDLSFGGFSLYRIAKDRTSSFGLSNIVNAGKYGKGIVGVLYGQDSAVYHSPGRPLVFIFLLPLLAVGLWELARQTCRELRQRQPGAYTVTSAALAAYLILTLIIYDFHATRFNALYGALLPVVLLGVRAVFKRRRALWLLGAGAVLVAALFAGYMFTDLYADSRQAPLSDKGLQAVYRETRAQNPGRTIWVDTIAKEANASVIPYVVCLGVDLLPPAQVYYSTAGTPDAPYYENARFYVPYDAARREFMLYENDVYIIYDTMPSETRDEMRRQLESLGLCGTKFGEYTVYSK